MGSNTFFQALYCPCGLWPHHAPLVINWNHTPTYHFPPSMGQLSFSQLFFSQPGTKNIFPLPNPHCTTETGTSFFCWELSPFDSSWLPHSTCFPSAPPFTVLVSDSESTSPLLLHLITPHVRMSGMSIRSLPTVFAKAKDPERTESVWHNTSWLITTCVWLCRQILSVCNYNSMVD